MGTLDLLGKGEALNKQQRAIREEEEALLGALSTGIAELGAETGGKGWEEDAAWVASAVGGLDAPFLAVVVGEFNAGKSTFVNALLGSSVMDTGVTPTTAEVTVVAYGDEATGEKGDVHGAADGVRRIRLPHPWLRDINVVDTPGTNAVIREHERITTHFIPRADLVLFLTSAYSPFAASEKAFMAEIADAGKKIVVVLNKADVVADPTERKTIADFVASNAAQVLHGTPPPVMFVSARDAAKAKKAQASLAGTGFDQLERYIVDSFGSDERIRLKLASPLGHAIALADSYAAAATAAVEVYASDHRKLEAVEAELAKSRTAMESSLAVQLDKVDSVLYQLAERGDAFFEAQLTLSNFRALLDKGALRSSFEQDVVKDLSYQIESHVNEFIDWFVERNNDQWSRVYKTLNSDDDHDHDHDSNNLDDAGSSPQHEIEDAKRSLVRSIDALDMGRRTELLDHIGAEASAVASSFDKRAEAAKLADSLRSTMVSALGATGALGLGTALVVAMTDVTGTLLLGVLAASGLYILPYRKRQLKAELRTKISELRTKLNDSLTHTFHDEASTTEKEIRTVIKPYASFVVSRGRQLESLSSTFTTLSSSLSRLRNELAPPSDR